MYAALLPQFIDAASGQVVMQAAVLGGTHIAVSLAVHSVLVFAAGPAAVLLSGKPSWLRKHQYATGALLAAFAVELAMGAASGVGLG